MFSKTKCYVVQPLLQTFPHSVYTSVMFSAASINYNLHVWPIRYLRYAVSKIALWQLSIWKNFCHQFQFTSRITKMWNRFPIRIPRAAAEVISINIEYRRIWRLFYVPAPLYTLMLNGCCPVYGIDHLKYIYLCMKEAEKKHSAAINKYKNKYGK